MRVMFIMLVLVLHGGFWRKPGQRVKELDRLAQL